MGASQAVDEPPPAKRESEHSLSADSPALVLQVANDEASHFQQLQQRLEAIGSSYGALPVHDGLWESAAATAHSLPARLAVESCVHEARGLDRLPHTIQRFRNSGDGESSKLLEKIYQVCEALMTRKRVNRVDLISSVAGASLCCC